MKSDNAFYITLALIGVFGILAIILLKDKSKSSLGDLASDDDYVRKTEIKDYIMKCIAARNDSKASPIDMRMSYNLVRKLPENTLYEGKEY